MKVFIFRGFDLDNFREANPHLRGELIDATSDQPWCNITTRSYHRKLGPARCFECGAEAPRAHARKHWTRLGPPAAYTRDVHVTWRCADCHRKRRGA